MNAHTSFEDRRRPGTQESHLKGVETALALMRRSYRERLTLSDLADSAHMSEFHFSRVFKMTTRLAPMQFLSAIRVAEAKKAFLETPRSVTDICWDVGYESLGSFSTHFTEMVGATPREWRGRMGELATLLGIIGIDRLPTFGSPSLCESTGHVVDAHAETLVCVGLYSRPLPFGRPDICNLCFGPTRFPISESIAGARYVFALGIAVSDLPRLMASDFAGCHVASAALPAGRAQREECVIRLRAPLVTDPPVLSALPLFLAERFHLHPR